MALTQEQQTYHETAQREINATVNWMRNYAKKREGSNGASVVAAYDSCVADAEADNNLDEAIPKVLRDIFDSAGPENKAYILGAIDSGIRSYQAVHGGEMPRADMVATALADGLIALKSVDGYDSTVNGTQLNSSGMESHSVIPAAAIVAISSRIATSIPIIAYLPNANGSNQVPVVYGRNIAKNSFGAVKAGEYIDGKGASLQYFDPIFEFVMTQDTADAKSYTLSPTVTYANGTLDQPDPNAPALPFMGGRVRILVNGVTVGDDATRDHAKFTGPSAIIPKRNHHLVVAGVEVAVVSGIADLSANTVQVSFKEELPAGAVVTAELIADFERTEANGEKQILLAPSVDVDLVARDVYAYPMRGRYRATTSSIYQVQRELGLDIRGAVTAVISSKFLLEQNVRLLRRLKKRAIGFGRVFTADLHRGATETPAFNNTSEQARELLVSISMGKVNINKLLDIVPSGHDLYVTDKMSVLFDNLADDTHYKKLSSAVGSPNQITRIGQIGNNINVYHVPEDAQLLTESNSGAEIMLVGRSGDPVRNPFVGFPTVPFTVRESNTQDFVQGVTIEATGAADLNPLDRFCDQCVVIQVVNLPVSITGA
ncbi:hypothetical protein [Acinetobacter chengduensis]|uniref:Major capsid protein n=1 Tax=Acinetobacter chengduensis TaxID=2420890 RepID=A0ABX9TSW3_9GAMM|nr:hypothetical protein [Acinetobacter chengduensis]RLL18997.1 hypothetical protein D9K81_14670 [Acinetobacter chengduensis]